MLGIQPRTLEGFMVPFPPHCPACNAVLRPEPRSANGYVCDSYWQWTHPDWAFGRGGACTTPLPHTERHLEAI